MSEQPRQTRVAIISGIRTPFCKAGGVYRDLLADDLGVYVLKELIARAPFDSEIIDEVIIGNVMQPAHAGNIARVIAVKAGLPVHIPAYTVNRNCASGMQAILSAADRILLGQAQVILAGGVESMSNVPILFPKQMGNFLAGIKKAKGWMAVLKMLLTIRPALFMPQIPELLDPLCGLTMGQTAELIIRELGVTREEQDAFAWESQKRACKAIENGRFKEEIVPVPLPLHYKATQLIDDGPRFNQTMESLQKLRPAFDQLFGSVTAGNSSQVTDGAAALFVMSEDQAKALGLRPLGYLRASAEVGLDPCRMGLGPVYAMAKLLESEKLSLADINLIEINEAFAGQVLAVLKACASDEFAKKSLKRDKALGVIDRHKLNVNGGAIALGHPLGASGVRMIFTLLLELNKLKSKGVRLGLASLCVGGGQGQACLLEVDP